MSVRDLIPQNLIWWRNREDQLPAAWRDEDRDPFAGLQREMNRLFDDFFRSAEARLPALAGRGPLWGGLAWPRLEISETDREIRVSAELPGLEEKDVELLLDNGTLTIRGEKSSASEDEDADKGRQFSERFYGRFERRIPLPEGIEQDKAEARFANGVLSVTLPKSETAQSRARRIEIRK